MVTAATLEADELSLQRHFRAEDLTDGLPIIVPTVDRVDDYLERSGFAPHRGAEIGTVLPLNVPVTLEDVAVNSLMAGARPEDLGVILAAVEAMQDHEYQLDKVQFTTNPVAPVMFVSGPVVDEIGIGSSHHAIGPGRHPNGAIGRALRLILRNLGGANDEIDHATFGQPAKYTFCMGEASGKSPWEPLHASRGFDAGQSVVTMAGMENLVNIVPITDRHTEMAGPLFHQVGRVMQAIGTNVFYSHGSPVIVLTPGQAQRLQEEGYDRAAAQRAFFEAGSAPEESYIHGNFCLGNWIVEDGKVRPCGSAEDIVIVVAGGDESLHCLYLQPFCYTKAASREVWTPARFG